MDKNRIQKFLSSTRVLQFVFFVAAVTLVTYFFPREGKFRYTFQEGKPWKYGLLTAPFDFPVYKDEAVIQQERDSIMLDFQPVFSHNESIEKKSVDDFEKALSNYTEMSIPPTLRKNLVQALREAYRKGIVSSEAYTQLQSGKFKEIRILENNVAREIPVSELQSAREAYENMLNKFPDSYSHHILQTCNLNDFLNTNIAFDSITTDRLKDNLLQRIALSDGIVQAGERIVDRGEIITPQTYRILKSLETVTLKKASAMTTVVTPYWDKSSYSPVSFLFLSVLGTVPSADFQRDAYPRLYDDAHRGHLLIAFSFLNFGYKAYIWFRSPLFPLSWSPSSTRAPHSMYTSLRYLSVLLRRRSHSNSSSCSSS